MKRKIMALLLSACMVAGMLTGCGTEESAKKESAGGAAEDVAQENEETAGEETEDGDFIANRTISIINFQAGLAVPENQEDNPVFNEIEKRTGIRVNVETMQSADVFTAATLALASGELPDIVVFLNAQAELTDMFAKAAVDGMFIDMAPYLTETDNLSFFLDSEKLTKEANDLYVHREEYGDAVYMIEGGYVNPDVISNLWVANTGYFIRNDIVETLGIDPTAIKTQEQLFELAKQIEEGDFVDANGNKVIPIGATAWGGTAAGANGARNSNVYVPNYNFGGEYNIGKTSDGSFAHVAMTDYCINGIKEIRKLLDAGLMDKEALTMDGTQGIENFANGRYGITVMHLFTQSWDTGYDSLWQNEDKNMLYQPLGPMTNWDGSEGLVISEGNGGSCAVLIPSTTENPEECIEFLDWLCSCEGRRLINYGIEGEHYTLIERTALDYREYVTESEEDDMMQEVLTDDFVARIEEDPNYKVNQGIEINPLNMISKNGMYTDSWIEGENKYMNYGIQMRGAYIENTPIKLVPGIAAENLLTSWEGIDSLQPVLDSYNDVYVRACFAANDQEAEQVIADYQEKLENAGIDAALEWIAEKEAEDPGSVLGFSRN